MTDQTKESEMDKQVQAKIEDCKEKIRTRLTNNWQDSQTLMLMTSNRFMEGAIYDLAISSMLRDKEIDVWTIEDVSIPFLNETDGVGSRFTKHVKRGNGSTLLEVKHSTYVLKREVIGCIITPVE